MTRGTIWLVQLIPSGEVANEPLLPTATNKFNPEAQVTEFQLAVGEVCRVQEVPFGEVIIEPSEPTATNKLRVGDQVTEFQFLIRAV